MTERAHSLYECALFLLLCSANIEYAYVEIDYLVQRKKTIISFDLCLLNRIFADRT